ncbi:MAG: ABC transporter permease [Alistipes sp.]|nr:ABC transporter permease [Alistipes sp.]MBQ8367380.1 ABC transporter permease [Alistipes sp.]
MRVEFDIARRLSSRRAGAKAGIMERVATIATGVSIAVIIITLSVVIGFKHDLRNLLTGASADITVTAPQSGGVVSGKRIEHSAPLVEALQHPDIARYSPYTAKEGVLKSDDNILGVMLKGVDDCFDPTFYKEHIVEGRFPRIGLEPRTKDILISESIARKMDVAVGDRIEMVFVDAEGGILRDRFEISGLYHTGVDIIDNGIVLTDIRNVARLYDGNSAMVTGFDLWLREGAESDIVARELNGGFIDLYLATGCQAEAFTAEAVFPDIFGWLATHDITAMAVVVIMIIVALLNMTTSLLIIVLERQRMIGELRALGMRRGAVVGIFLFRALFITARGVVWGAMAGIVIVVIQHLWAVVPLPSEGYLLEAVPVALCWGWWLAAIVATIAITLIVMLLPAALAAKISPTKIMRYE